MSKKPLVKWGKYKRYLPPLWRLVQWFASGQNNIALVCGTGNLVILDFDSFSDYNQWLHSNVQYTNTRMVRTARGIHLYYFVDNIPDINYSHNGAEVKCSGLCMSAPSVHPSGYKYQVVNDVEIMKLNEAPRDKRLVMNKGRVVTGNCQPTPTPFSITRRSTTRGHIQVIKDNVSITDLFPEYVPSGSHYAMTYCPMHDDNKPSLSLDLESDRANCFKIGCPLNGIHGHDVVDIWGIVNEMSTKEAIRSLLNRLEYMQ